MVKSTKKKKVTIEGKGYIRQETYESAIGWTSVSYTEAKTGRAILDKEEYQHLQSLYYQNLRDQEAHISFPDVLGMMYNQEEKGKDRNEQT